MVVVLGQGMLVLLLLQLVAFSARAEKNHYKSPPDSELVTDSSVQSSATAASSKSSSSSSVGQHGHIPTIPIGKDVFGKVVELPLVGAGTGSGSGRPYTDEQAHEAICKAFLAGYSLVDTAWIYKNQKGVGQAIRDCWIQQQQQPRDKLFVLTKIPGGLTRQEVLAAHQENLKELGLDYVDHLMTHYPTDRTQSPDRSTPERRQEEWKALQEIYKTGQARSIGISHYCPRHIHDILQVSDVVTPSINQVEQCHGDVPQTQHYIHELLSPLWHLSRRGTHRFTDRWRLGERDWCQAQCHGFASVATIHRAASSARRQNNNKAQQQHGRRHPQEQQHGTHRGQSKLVSLFIDG